MKWFWIASAFAFIASEILCDEVNEDKKPIVLSAERFYRTGTRVPGYTVPPVEISWNETKKWKQDYWEIVQERIRVDEPYFEEIARADKCRDQAKSLRNCFACQSGFHSGPIKIRRSYDDSESRERLQNIKKIPGSLSNWNGTVETFETDEDCTNIQLDLLECIEEVVNTKEAKERIDLYFRKVKFYENAFNRPHIEEPFLEAIVKADRCNEEMRLMGICLTYQAITTKKYYDVITINLTNRAPLMRKTNIEKVQIEYHDGNILSGQVHETDDDCTNLQLDLEECILKVVDENKE